MIPMDVRLPNDFGPIYTETNMLQFPVEPWNTYSNIIFLLIFLYWLKKIHGGYNKHLLFSIGLPLLLIGFVGGTVFHATRMHPVWLYMDFMPILILLTLTAFHLWYLLTSKLSASIALTFASFGLNFVMRKFVFLPLVWKISLGYSLSAILVLLPAFILSYKHKWNGVGCLLFTIMYFFSAVLFRQIDKGLGAEVFPMGTHFLWHLCGGMSAFYIMKFIYIIETGKDS